MAKQPLPQDRRILEALGRYQVLTAKQVCRLFFGKSLTYVQSQVMPRLVAAGLVQALHFPKTMRYGSFPIIYTLTPAGWREIGTTPPRFKRTEQHPSHLLHTLAVTDVWTGATPRCPWSSWSMRGISSAIRSRQTAGQWRPMACCAFRWRETHMMCCWS